MEPEFWVSLATVEKHASMGNETSRMSSESDAAASSRYLPYPASTLSPRIMPVDLTSHKSRGIAAVQQFFQARLSEMGEEYLSLVDRFNWNKLIYEARYGFEPTVGQSYHLYQLADGHALSMIEPEKWPAKRWVGTFRLGADGQWEPQKVSREFDLRDWVAGRAGPGGH